MSLLLFTPRRRAVTIFLAVGGIIPGLCHNSLQLASSESRIAAIIEFWSHQPLASFALLVPFCFAAAATYWLSGCHASRLAMRALLFLTSSGCLAILFLLVPGLLVLFESAAVPPIAAYLWLAFLCTFTGLIGVLSAHLIVQRLWL